MVIIKIPYTEYQFKPNKAPSMEFYEYLKLSPEQQIIDEIKRVLKEDKKKISETTKGEVKLIKYFFLAIVAAVGIIFTIEYLGFRSDLLEIIAFIVLIISSLLIMFGLFSAALTQSSYRSIIGKKKKYFRKLLKLAKRTETYEKFLFEYDKIFKKY